MKKLLILLALLVITACGNKTVFKYVRSHALANPDSTVCRLDLRIVLGQYTITDYWVFGGIATEEMVSEAISYPYKGRPVMDDELLLIAFNDTVLVYHEYLNYGQTLCSGLHLSYECSYDEFYHNGPGEHYNVEVPLIAHYSFQ